MCLAVIAGVLPLDWTRVEISGCNGQPGEVHIRRGWELLSDGAWILGVLTLLTLFLLWRSVRIEPAWRLFPASLGLIANGLIAFAVYFSTTFELFSRTRILWPGWVAVSSAGVLALEGLVRFFAEIAALVRRRRRSKHESLREHAYTDSLAPPGPPE